MAPRKPSPVDDYRPRVPRAAVVAAARERLAAVEPGGSPAVHIAVESASQIEVRALSMPCLRCDGPYRLDEHTAETIDGHAVRLLRVHCGHCGAHRKIHFRIVPTRLS